MKSNYRAKGPRRRSLRVGAALSVLFLSGITAAFNVVENDYGNEARWEDPPESLLYDRCSVSTGGARFRAALDNVVHWQKTGKLLNPIALGAGDDDCELRTNDGVNEFGYASPGAIDGGLGRTTVRSRIDGTIKESDVVIATNVSPLPASDPDTATAGGVGRGSMLHEFGHYIGLDHDFDFLNIMRQGIKPHVPAHKGFVMVFPDDKDGALRHYEANVVGELNVFVSAQTFLSDLPQDNQDAYLAIYGNPAGPSDRVLSYNLPRIGTSGAGFDWQVFNPDAMACTAFSNAGAPSCAALDGPFSTFMDGAGDTVIMLCPGDPFNVPYSLGSRSDPLDTAIDHQVGVYLGQATSVTIDTQIMLESNERDVSTQGAQARVDRVELSDDPDCILPGDYSVWVVADTCQQLLEANEVTVYSPGSVLERDNILRTSVKVRVLDPGDPSCSPGPASDGVCNNSGFREICPFPPVNPPGPGPDYGDCSNAANPGDPSVRGELGCKCRDLDLFADFNEEGGYPDGTGSYLEVQFDSPGQYCEGEDVVCNAVDGGAICHECGVDTNLGCPCFAQADCAGVEEDLRCWGSEDDGWSPGSKGTCLPDGNTPTSRERLTEMPWFCLDGCASISPSGDPVFNGCVYRQAGFDLTHGECADVAFVPDGLVTGQCEAEGGRSQTSETVNLNTCFGEPPLPPGDIVCVSECDCHEDCPALGFPDDYGCSLFIGTGGTTVGRCVPPECLNPTNDLLGLCQMFL